VAKSHVLVVDDEELYRRSLGRILSRVGHQVSEARDAAEALSLLAQGGLDLVVADVRMPGLNGLELVRQIHEIDPDLPCIVVTGFGSAESSIEALRAGAFWYLEKPFDQAHLDVVRRLVEQAIEHGRLKAENRALQSELRTKYRFENIVGHSGALRSVLDIVAKVARTDSTVLITGESGTGKELVAEAIHRNSRRAQGPFVKVNLGGISASLFESEMFGHVKGAFTDARTDRKGRFEIAHGGTIFLDEIGDLDAASQVKMLRVLQDRTFEVLGSSQRRSVDVRVVSATNRNLAEMVARGEFREDLLYRINLIAVQLPPLRERRDDIPLLANRFLQTVGQMYRREGIRLSPGAVSRLQAQPWPGNIRQLRQSVERTLLITERSVLEADDFRTTAEMEPREAGRDTLPAVGSMTMDEIEKAMILKSLKHHAGNISKVAEALGLSRAALYRRFEKYEIHV
jgi:two-component system NtrC family response regulator